MATELQQTFELNPPHTQVSAKLVNMFAAPGLVFDEVAGAPFKVLNWFVPTCLVCLSGLAILHLTTDPEGTSSTIRQLLEAGTITQERAATLTQHWQSISGLILCGGTFLGTFWSAFALWFMGRFLLKAQVGFLKSLEVASLAATILILGTILTGFLAAALGEASARPALSLLLLKGSPDNPLRMALGIVDIFQLLTTGVLAIGLSRLAGVSFKEAAFWVFGYWVVGHIALIVLT